MWSRHINRMKISVQFVLPSAEFLRFILFRCITSPPFNFLWTKYKGSYEGLTGSYNIIYEKLSWNWASVEPLCDLKQTLIRSYSLTVHAVYLDFNPWANFDQRYKKSYKIYAVWIFSSKPIFMQQLELVSCSGPEVCVFFFKDV